MDIKLLKIFIVIYIHRIPGWPPACPIVNRFHLFKICKRLRGSRQKLSFDNELGSGNVLKIRGWTSQLVVINSGEH